MAPAAWRTPAAPTARRAPPAASTPSCCASAATAPRVHLDHVAADPTLLTVARAAATLGPWTAPGWEAIPPQPARVVAGVIASADVWTADPEDLRALRADYGRRVRGHGERLRRPDLRALHGVPFLAVRVISNNDAACARAAPGRRRHRRRRRPRRPRAHRVAARGGSVV
ncbi:MAG: hypothetical protein U0531_20300 [Dehalococcoidia bacterium]